MKRTAQNSGQSRPHTADGCERACLGTARPTGRGLARSFTVVLAFFFATAFLPAFSGEAEDEFEAGLEALLSESSETAAVHFRIAAEAGHANAQYILGRLYEDGDGVEQDDEEAMKWIRMAADQGEPEAQKYLKHGRFRSFMKRHEFICKISIGAAIIMWIDLLFFGVVLNFGVRAYFFFRKRRARNRMRRGETDDADAKPLPEKKTRRKRTQAEKDSVHDVRVMRRRYEKIKEQSRNSPTRHRTGQLIKALLNWSLVFLVELFCLAALFVAAYIGILFMLSLSGFSLYGALIAIFLGAPFFIVVSWYFKRRRITGMPLDPGEYARLYDEVRGLCDDLGVAPIRKICLDMSFRITVFSRFMDFAFLRRDVLVIGYPLLCALDAGSFRIALARTLRHEQSRFSRRSLLKWLEFLWGFPPDRYNPGAGTRGIQPGNARIIRETLLPLQIQEERLCDAYCREAFGEQDFAAYVTQTGFRGGQWSLPDFVLDRTGGDFFGGHPAAVIRDEVRKTLSEAETKDILENMLRIPEPPPEPLPEPPETDTEKSGEEPELLQDAKIRRLSVKLFRSEPSLRPDAPDLWQEVTLPLFRERVGTDDPGELLPYLARTPDALEHYLSPGADFEGEFNRTLKKSLTGELYQIFGLTGYDFEAGRS